MNLRKIAFIILALSNLLVLGENTRGQWSVGVRDTRYIFADYYPVSDLRIKLEQSLYSGNMGYQRVGLDVSYTKELFRNFIGCAGLSGATAWNARYQVAGGYVSLTYRYRFINVNGMISPLYDTGIGYNTCWKAGVGFDTSKPISINLAYSTIPEYRTSEARARIGIGFKVKNLSVSPGVSVGMEKKTILKNLRVLISMRYLFPR